MLAKTVLLVLLLSLARSGGATETSECPEDWLESASLCVWVSAYTDVWYRAYEDCKSHDSHLAYVESLEEHNILRGILVAKEPGDVWIGLNDLDVEGSFQWVDREPIAFTQYASGQPSGNSSDHSNEDCVAMSSSDLTYKWDDQYCFKENRYVCRKDMATSEE